MKKRIYLLLTLIISIFVGVKSVEAAKELTCIYKGGLQDASKMLVQNSTGEQFMFIDYDNTTDIDSPEWYDPLDVETQENSVEIDFHTSVSSSRFDENGYLLSCPLYAQKMKTSWNGSGYIYKFSFSDKDTGMLVLDYDFVYKYDKLPALDVYNRFYRDKNSEYLVEAQEIEKSEKYKKCIYTSLDSGNVNLYFNQDKYILINEANLIYQSGTKFTLQELLNVADASTTTNGCPIFLYRKITSNADVNNMFADYFLYSDNSTGILELTLLEEEGEWEIKIVEPEIPIDDCEDLFGEELVEKINSIMDWIKILIPILLIGFGIIDFTKAIFAGSTDEMSKAQKTFFKRVVAAILVFISPIVVNLILNLANEVWGFISPDTCIVENK